MMKRLTTFLTGVIVGGALATISLKYHIVRASDGHHWIPKAEARFSGAYVDIRDFSWEDWQQRPELAIAISRSGSDELVSEAARQTARQTLQDLLD